MEKVIKEVIFSEAFYQDLKSVYLYGFETFGETMAEILQEQIMYVSKALSIQYLIHPECKHLETKSQMYRNIILGKYLIIYKIKSNKIEVLRAMHGSQSPSRFRNIRGIRP